MDNYQKTALMIGVLTFASISALVIIAAVDNLRYYNEITVMESEFYSCKACTKCYAYEENVRYGWTESGNVKEWSCNCYNLETEELTGECEVRDDGRVKGGF